MNAGGYLQVAEQPLLSMRGIDKSFPGVQALQGVDLQLRAGEVLALVGENGAGKSTLIKILGGAHTSDAGSIEINGRPLAITSPAIAQQAGISIIYQEFNLVGTLTASENIFLGREESVAGFVRRRDERRRAHELFNSLGVQVDPSAPCRELTVGQQQVVEIARALSLEARIIVMDEPSATLSPQEVGRLFEIIRELKVQGLGVIYISHRLEEVFQIADRVMVLRDGSSVGTRPMGDVTRNQLIELMVGRSLTDEFPPPLGQPGREILAVNNLSKGTKVRDVSFSVREGEILGITGLVGAGRTEMVRLVFGADRADSGAIELNGHRLVIRRPRDAIREGICLLTEDRKSQGLVLAHSVLENFGLPNLPRFSRFGFVRERLEHRAFGRYVDSMKIRIPHDRVPARNLSGGNQQKVVLAKWLERHCRVMIFDEPTRGIDVAAKYEIYSLMRRLAAEGKAVIMISSELPAILGMSDRILVMHSGRITGEITDVEHATQEQIMRLAVG